MDAIWQKEGLDLRMIPYGCLATGKNVGMIEVVRNAKTVMAIQKKQDFRAAMQVRTATKYQYLTLMGLSMRNGFLSVLRSALFAVW